MPTKGPRGVSRGTQSPTDTGQEFHYAARYQYEETKAASDENASKEERGINEAAYAGSEWSKQEGPPPCIPCCKVLPVQSRTPITKLRLKGPPLSMLSAEGGMESSHCSMGSRQSFLSSRKNLDTRRQQ